MGLGIQLSSSVLFLRFVGFSGDAFLGFCLVGWMFFFLQEYLAMGERDSNHQ